MIDWPRINTVLLDMDGTLLDLHFDSHFWLVHLPRRYAQIHDMEEEDARSHLLQMINSEKGSLNWYCLDYWSRRLGLNIRNLKEEIRDRIAFRPHVQDFLGQLRSQGLRTVIVTNAHQDSLSLKLETVGLESLVDKIYSTHSFGKPKEDPSFWADLQHVEPFALEHTLLVDDSIPVLESARQYGFKHLLAVLAPDSQQPPHTATGFVGCEHFDEVWPNSSRPPRRH